MQDLTWVQTLRYRSGTDHTGRAIAVLYNAPRPRSGRRRMPRPGLLASMDSTTSTVESRRSWYPTMNWPTRIRLAPCPRSAALSRPFALRRRASCFQFLDSSPSTLPLRASSSTPDAMGLASLLSSSALESRHRNARILLAGRGSSCVSTCQASLRQPMKPAS